VTAAALQVIFGFSEVEHLSRSSPGAFVNVQGHRLHCKPDKPLSGYIVFAAISNLTIPSVHDNHKPGVTYYASNVTAWCGPSPSAARDISTGMPANEVLKANQACSASFSLEGSSIVRASSADGDGVARGSRGKHGLAPWVLPVVISCCLGVCPPPFQGSAAFTFQCHLRCVVRDFFRKADLCRATPVLPRL
jgi:hypothetical protein